MKPVSEASGVRSSWLALARKSARIRSLRRRVGLVAQHQQRQPRAVAAPAGSGRVSTRQNRSWAPPVS